jgi:hypothetical protein
VVACASRERSAGEAKITFEIWEHACGFAVLRQGAKLSKDLLTPRRRLVHIYQAETLYAAYQTYYDFMG